MPKRTIFLLLFVIFAQCLFAGSNEIIVEPVEDTVLISENNFEPVFSVATGTSYAKRINRFNSGDTLSSKGALCTWMDISVKFIDWFALSLEGSHARHVYDPFTINEFSAGINGVFIIPNTSSFSPFVSVGIGETFFWNDSDKAYNPSLSCSLGCAYALKKDISLLVSATYSATFTHEEKLNPESLIDSVNHCIGASIGCAISFGKGVN